MLPKIKKTADEAGEQFEAIILRLEADRTIPLAKSVRMALYEAGTALSKLAVAVMLAQRA